MAAYAHDGCRQRRFNRARGARRSSRRLLFGAHHKGQALRAKLLGYFAVLFGGATLLLIANHRVRGPQLCSAVVLVPVFASGVSIGERIGTRVLPQWFDRAVSGLLLGSGIVALLT